MAPAARTRAAANGAIAAMMAAALLSMFDRSTMPPMLGAMAAGLDTTIAEVGAALAVFSIAYAGSQLPWSAVSSRLGQVRVLRIALGVAAASALLTALAVEPVMLWIGRVLAGLATGAIVPATLVHVGDTVPSARRAHALANIATATSLGMTLAVLLASALAAVGGWRWVFAITAVAELLVLLLLLRVPAGPRPSAPRPFAASLRRVLVDRWVLLVLVLVLVEGVMLTGVMGFLPIALEQTGTPPLLAGAVTGVYGLALIATAQLMKPALGRVRPAVLLAVGGVAVAVGYAGIALWLTVPSVLVASGLFGGAWAVAHTQMQHWMTDAVVLDRPVGTALFATSLFAGGAIGASIGSAVAAGGSFPALFLATAAAALAFAAAASLGRSRYRPRAD